MTAVRRSGFGGPDFIQCEMVVHSIIFSLYVHHRGKFIEISGERFYIGGELEGKHNFDSDMFGYFDVEGAIQDLGYESWKCIAYKVPNTPFYKDLNDDKAVSEMLAHLSAKCKVIGIYVDGGKKKGEGDTSGLGDKVSMNRGEEKGKSVQQEVDVNYVSEEDVSSWEYQGNESEDAGNEGGEMGKNSDHSDGEDVNLGSEGEDEEYIEAIENLRQWKGQGVLEDEDEQEHLSALKPKFVLEEEEVSHVESDYYLSDEVMDDSTGDEGDSCFRRSKKVYYDPRCNHKDMKVVLGMRFTTGFQCRSALRTWAIMNGHPITFKRCSKSQMQAKCKDPCKWKCWGSMMTSENTFVIRSIGEEHTCPFDVHNKQANYKWIAMQYIDDFRVRPEMGMSEFLEDCNRKFGVQPSRGRLYRAKAHALELLRGTVEHHYAVLRNYVAELVRVDREGRFELMLGDEAVFKGIYIRFSAIKKGFMVGCRWIIGLDGCHLKTHLGGQLLCAIGRDANNQMYPIAWGVVGVENQENWTWFLRILLEELGIRDGNGVTFMSDQQKGLLNAVRILAPYDEHRNCARHVYKNWKKQFTGATLMNIFWKAMRSTYQQEFDVAMEEMKAENQAAYEDFITRNPNKICKTFFSTMPVSDAVTNNISETFNGTIVKSRSKHIIHMLEDIRSHLRQRQYVKMEKINRVIDRLCPKIREKLEELKQFSRRCIANPGLYGVFEVKHREKMFAVNLDSKTCTCRSWYITRIPCIHALGAIHYMKHDAADYVSDYFTVETYKRTYSFSMGALNGEQMWPKADGYPVQPPIVQVMPGRPKKNRRKERDERDPKKPNRMRKLGVQIKCSNCNQIGHNKKTCKNVTVEKPVKGKRGRPRKNPTNEAGSSNPTLTESQRRVLQRENTVGSAGFGILQSEVSGNAWLNGILVDGHPVASASTRGRGKKRVRRGGHSTSGNARNAAPTQESQAP